MKREKMDCDVLIAGAGSGGIGAALAAARLGLSVVLVEKADMIGGTAVRAGVNVWEPVAGATGIPFDIYRRLRQIPLAVGIYSYGRHCCWHKDAAAKPFPGGEQIIDPARRYVDTLQKHGQRSFGSDEAFSREYFHGVVFEPEAFTGVVEQLLAETGCCRLVKNVALADVTAAQGRIDSVTLSDGRTITADTFIDATGDGLLCRACGCEMMAGRESRSRFHEPHAPENPAPGVNAVSLIFRVRSCPDSGIEPLPDDISEHCWWREDFPVVSATQYPCGDYNMNMLPTMDGGEFLSVSPEAAYRECRRRVLAFWHYLQTIFPEFRMFRLSWIAPALGVRESARVVGEYVLTEHDLLAGLHGQGHPDIIALADHAMDRHGDSGGYYGLDAPYGIPFRCLVPKGFRNLLIACRAAGFSSLAASSCRLSRTMMQLGQATGTAAALAKQRSVPVSQVSADLLRASLIEQHVQLDWPTPPELAAYLARDDFSLDR